MIGGKHMALGLCALGAVSSIAAAQSTAPAGGQQVAAGARLYASGCAQCHGPAMQGGAGPALRPVRVMRLVGKPPLAPANLARYIRLNMPPTDPGTISAAQSEALAAFILSGGPRG